MLDDQEGLPIYDNICLHVNIRIGRQLTYDDLALMELIYPEAVQNDKIYLYNPDTLCMDPHLKVTLRYDVVAGHTECSDIAALSREFDSRLFKHFDYYGEDIDVPGAELPYPFNTRQNTVIRINSKVHSSNEELRDICQPFPKEVCDLPNPELAKLYNKWKITDSPDLSIPWRSIGTEHNKLNSMFSQNSMKSDLLAKRFSDISITDDEGVLLAGESTFAAGPSSKHQQRFRTDVHL